MADLAFDDYEPLIAPSVKPDAAAYLDDYVLDLARRLRVGDWEILLPREFTEQGSYASVQFTHGKRTVLIRFCHWFVDRTLEQQRHSIAHELIHLHLNAMEESFNALSPRLSGDVYQVAWSHFNRHLEEATDQLTYLLAPTLPLPPNRPPVIIG